MTSTGDQHWRPPPLHGHAPCACGNHPPRELPRRSRRRSGTPAELQRLPTAQRSFEHGGCDGALETAPRLSLDHADAHDGVGAHDNVGAHDSVHDISPRKEEKSAPDQSSASVSIDCQAHSSDTGGATTGASVSAKLGTQPYSAAGRLTSCRYGQTAPAYVALSGLAILPPGDAGGAVVGAGAGGAGAGGADGTRRAWSETR